MTPPGPISDLSVIGQTAASLTLRWTVPGDDGAGGGAAQAYDIRYATAPINDGNFGSATPVSPAPGAPAGPGTLQTHVMSGLSGNTLYYIAMKTLDEVPNISALSNVATGTTLVPAADSTPPGTVTDLMVISATYLGVTLHWTAPGDDGFSGTATSYDVRYSHAPITAANFIDATPAASEPPPGPANSLQAFTVTGLGPGTWYFALK
ncbi:MAG: glycohydrolase, partial [bacterium]